MNYQSGTFKCPKCGNNKVNDFKNWAKRDENDYGELNSKWIFYEQEINKQWICCICCFCNKKDNDEREKDFNDSCCSARRCVNTLLCKCNEESYPVFALCYHLIVIFYILFFFWFDLFSYLCCSKKRYSIISGEEETRGLLPKNNNIWDEIKGSTEDEMNRKYNLWKCSQCNYSSKTFVEFIPKKTYKTINQNKELKNDDDNGENDMEIKLKNEESYENDDKVYYYDNNEVNEVIAVNFYTPDMTIFNYCIPCKISDQFKTVLNRLYEEYPDYTKKECAFLFKGSVIDQNKSMAENKIINGSTITILPIEED